ncbi:ATP-dependent Clp protease adapter ClpS [Euzebya sp.]|uniref:ATP-dependent Clp protease adapter ClpS n=1 Tax=Euzebya sp. TaxID=1971409 RepID=UPI003511F5AE
MHLTSSTPTVAPDREEVTSTDTRDDSERLWEVVVWNDPVTLMSYVVFVLRKLFGYDEATATQLMMQVHEEGKAIVSSGPREKAEMDVHRLHAHGLQATLTRG